ncbi:MAG: hypothetical protein HC945_04165 [Nitrosarchaeum sp.]|nr:hypothetical protein [Nitrosarchaeum sp.]
MPPLVEVPRVVRVVFTHPEGVEPGAYVTYIAAIEGSPDAVGNVAARAMVRTGFTTRVLGPEKYVKASLSVSSVNKGEVAKGSILVDSWTLSDIGSLYADVSVSGPDGASVAQLQTERVRLPATSKQVLEFEVPTGAEWSKGVYPVRALLHYDDETLELSSGFRVGTLEVSIVNVSQHFVRGVINPVVIGVASDWNGKIRDVYAQVDVGGQLLLTPQVELGAFGKADLRAFWDASAVDVGEYPAKVTLLYENASVERTVTFIVREPAKDPDAVKPWYLSGVGIAWLVVIVFMLVNLYLLFFRKGGGRKNHEE